MEVLGQDSPRIEHRGEIGRRPVTAKVMILVVLLSGGVGAVLGSVFPPEVLMAHIHQAANQRELASVPPSATASNSPANVGEQSASPAPEQEPVSVLSVAPAPDHAVSPDGQRSTADQAKSTEASVSRDTGEKPERKSARHRKAGQERAAPAKRKQYPAPSNAALAKSPGTPSQVPSISTRLSEQWWR
jgi:hypothetical protein